jgi:hypothetical protein
MDVLGDLFESYCRIGPLHPLSTYIISLVLSTCCGWRLSFASIRPVVHPVICPSKFLILEEEDGRGGGGRMAAAAVYSKFIQMFM